MAHRSRRDHDPATDTGISGIALRELIPIGASNRKISGHDLLRAVEVLNELKRRIDGDAEFAITHRGKWYLQAARTASITKTAIWQMESVELVIRNLLQWYAVIGDRKPTRRSSAPSAKGRSK